MDDRVAIVRDHGIIKLQCANAANFGTSSAGGILGIVPDEYLAVADSQMDT